MAHDELPVLARRRVDSSASTSTVAAASASTSASASSHIHRSRSWRGRKRGTAWWATASGVRAAAKLVLIALLLWTLRIMWTSELVHADVPEERTSPLAAAAAASSAELSRLECVAWRATFNCSADGERLPARDRSCAHVVAASEAGYCEFHDRLTGTVHRLMRSNCDSAASRLAFTCEDAPKFVQYNVLAVEYAPERPMDVFSARKDLADENRALFINETQRVAPLRPNVDDWMTAVSFKRGIAIVVYGKQLLSVYASVRSLRSLGCGLPIELWYSPKELSDSHALLQTLQRDFNCFVRVLRHPRAVGYFSKAYAIAFTAFDQVLFLDADNFAVRDPTYLFETSEFIEKGAIFWPDFWRPSRTTFDVTRDSFVWELLGLDFVDMFEQESGQVLIDKSRHQDALRALLHYALTSPNYIQDLKLLWGDKDLFRMAWLRTKSPFHMIDRPPGSAGPTASLPSARPTVMDVEGRAGSRRGPSDVFCGFTMVQHDPQGEIIFLHRNSVKLRWGRSHLKLWTHIQQFRPHHELRYYEPSEVIDRVTFPDLNSCWGKFVDYDSHYSVLPLAAFPFEDLEDKLLAYAREAEPLVCNWPLFCGIFY